VTFASRGLLIEESRTNLWSRSQEFSTSPWSVTATTTIATDDISSPSGSVTAERIIVGATTQLYGIFNNSVSFTSGTSYAASFFVKANQVTRVAIQSNNTALLPISAIFDLTGSGSIVGTPTGTASIQQFSNGWYRCSVVGTALSSGITAIRLSPVSGTSTNYVGNSVDSFYAWGAQLEVGSLATSYIPTTTGSVIRAADVCNITSAAFTSFYNSVEGTLFANAASLGVSSSVQNPVVSIESGTSQVLRIRHLATTNRIGAIVSGVSLIPSSGFDAVGVFYKSALSAGPTGADFVINGTQIPDTFTGSSLSADNMKIAVSTAGLSNTIISSIRYYKKQFPVPKLQALTA